MASLRPGDDEPLYVGSRWRVKPLIGPITDLPVYSPPVPPDAITPDERLRYSVTPPPLSLAAKPQFIFRAPDMSDFAEFDSLLGSEAFLQMQSTGRMKEMVSWALRTLAHVRVSECFRWPDAAACAVRIIAEAVPGRTPELMRRRGFLAGLADEFRCEFFADRPSPQPFGDPDEERGRQELRATLQRGGATPAAAPDESPAHPGDDGTLSVGQMSGGIMPPSHRCSDCGAEFPEHQAAAHRCHGGGPRIHPSDLARLRGQTGEVVTPRSLLARTADPRTLAERMNLRRREELLKAESRAREAEAEGRLIDAAAEDGLLYCLGCRRGIPPHALSTDTTGGPPHGPSVQIVQCRQERGGGPCNLHWALTESTIGRQWRSGTVRYRVLRCDSLHYSIPTEDSNACAVCGSPAQGSPRSTELRAGERMDQRADPGRATIPAPISADPDGFPSRPPSMTKMRILFFAANPKASRRLALPEEAREIEMRLVATKHRDAFEFKTMWAVRPDDLQAGLLREDPTIVHFSGHGSGPRGIVLHGRTGRKRTLVTADALKDLFSTLKGRIRVVVLNACYSEVQANAIAEVVDCVVGMKDSIGDEAALEFAASFYRGLGFGRSVKTAFSLGVGALKLAGFNRDEDSPTLVARTGVDLDKLVLVDAGTDRP